MMTVFIAVLVTCTNANLDVQIKCEIGASKEVWASMETCEKEAPSIYGRPIRCISTEVELTGTAAGKKVKLK